jgi:hypothetical protein
MSCWSGDGQTTARNIINPAVVLLSMLAFSYSEENALQPKPRPSVKELVCVFHLHEGIPFLTLSAVDHSNTLFFFGKAIFSLSLIRKRYNVLFLIPVFTVQVIKLVQFTQYSTFPKIPLSTSVPFATRVRTWRVARLYRAQ